MSNLKSVEQGRATFAYECAEDGKKILDNTHSIERYKKNPDIEDNYFKDGNYKSYVKKIPMMVKTNGLGNTFSYILSKQKKYDKKKNKIAGDKGNPKNAYDLIYYQVGEWLKKDHKKYLLGGKENEDLVKVFIQLDSAEYRAVTVEVLAFFNWLRRFAEGLIEGEGEN